MHPWRIALRTLVRRPGFTLTATGILTLGIGLTTTLFSVVDTILLKPLPYPGADRLVTVYEASPAKNKRESLVAPPRLEDWNRLTQAFSAIAGQYSENLTDTSGREPERLAGRRVSPRFFDVYATKPLLGRTFQPNEEVEGGPLTAVISYGLWTRRYGQNPAAIGERLVLAGKGCTIIGVMPKDFAAPAVDLWLPAQFNNFLLVAREERIMSGIGRMKPGVTIEQAQADLARIQRQLGEVYPRTDRDWSALVRDMKEMRVGDYRRTLLLVFGAVTMLLLIGVANIGGLTLAQLHRRERELAIRSSLGASRGQVVGEVMREVLLISLAGAVAGAALAYLSLPSFVAFFSDLPRITEVHFDARAAGWAALASLMAALVFGAGPALQSTRANLAAILAESSRSVSAGRRLFQSALVVAQFAVTVVLLAGAGLLLRSYSNLNRVDPGFNTSRTVTFHVGAAWDEDRPRIGRMQQEILAALERMPGVEAAGMTNFLPATGATLNFQFTLEGLAGADPSTFTSGYRNVDAGYMQALKIPLIEGQWCDSSGYFDPARPMPTKSMVNRRFVELYGNGQSMIGRHWRTGPTATPSEIAGIVGDVHEDGLMAPAAPYIYDCLRAGSWPDPEYVVRTRGDAQALARQIPAVVHSVEPGRAVFGVKMLDTVLDNALEQPRLNSRFLAAFAGIAMLLASVGLYSLISRMVAGRTREIGVRMALGANRTEIAALIFAGAGKLVLAGLAAGLLLALAGERFIRSMLFAVSPLDSATLTGTIAILAIVAALATLLPARKAASIDPVIAIRED